MVHLHTPKSHIQPNWWTLPCSDLQHIVLQNLLSQHMGTRMEEEPGTSAFLVLGLHCWCLQPFALEDCQACNSHQPLGYIRVLWCCSVCLPAATNAGFFWFWQGVNVPNSLLVGLAVGQVARVPTPYLQQSSRVHAKGHCCYWWNSSFLLKISNELIQKTIWFDTSYSITVTFYTHFWGRDHYFQEKPTLFTSDVVEWEGRWPDVVSGSGAR